MNAVNIFHITLEIWGSVFCLIAILCVDVRKHIDSKDRSFLLGLQAESMILLIADAVAWGFRGDPSSLGYVAVRLSNFVVYVMQFVIAVNYASYLQYNIYKRTGKPVRFRLIAVYLLAALGVILTVVSQFTGLFYTFDRQNFYHRSQWFWFSQVVGIVGSLICLSIVLQYRKALSRRRFFSFLSYIIFPLLALIIQVFVYGFSFMNMALTVSVMYMFAVSLIEQEQYLNTLQVEVMMSQIGEHFIFNSLSTIKNLCETDPEDAEDAIDEFATYLRGNIDAIGGSSLIPFSQELEHVQNYLCLEQRRFGDRLQVHYDIETESFVIPPLTLQPIVENSVKHGISKKAEGGTVTIATHKLQDAYEIIVSDDGMGFDPAEKKDDGRRHVGMENVTSRLEAMCRGQVEIESRIGQGTKVRILLHEV